MTKLTGLLLLLVWAGISCDFCSMCEGMVFEVKDLPAVCDVCGLVRREMV